MTIGTDGGGGRRWCTRREALRIVIGGVAAVTGAGRVRIASAAADFAGWVVSFRSRALARGVSGSTYDGAMDGVTPDPEVLALQKNQPEFNEKLWQYLNRRVSDWRIETGKQKATEHAVLLERIEREFGVARSVVLGLWGIESAYGDPIVQRNHMRPVIPALATLAWGEPRRRSYWEQELVNALRIIERGWSTPAEMRGSWAGAMGHTQWMPEVWLRLGVDYDRDGRVSPFGAPDDALGSSARYLVERGKYRRGEHWGWEVAVPERYKGGEGPRSYEAWRKAGVVRADGASFPVPKSTAKLWVPTRGGPAFLLGQNFAAVRTYNPSSSYTLAIVHLGDRIFGGAPLADKFPGGERALTLAEVQEVQRRLTALGHPTGGTDGRVGNATMVAIRDFQRKTGMEPADGYAGLRLLARLRESDRSAGS